MSDITAPRSCAREGCHNPVRSTRSNAAYCSNACKSAAWRDRTGYTLTATRKPSQTRRKCSGPSGTQLSWRKTVKVVAQLIQALAREPDTLARYANDPEKCTRLAELTLQGALSDRQRERLNARRHP